MEEDKYLRRHRDELNESNAVVTPICIVVDTSHSMVDGRFVDRSGKTRMQRLNDGISQFIEEIKKDDVLSDSVEIAIVTFNTEAGTALAFSTIDHIAGIDITGGASAGDTPKGVELALDVLQREKQLLIENRKKYNQPWLVIMSDGRATPGREAIDPSTGKKDFTDINRRLRIVQDKAKSFEKNKKLTVIPVLISETTDGQYYAAKNQMQGFTIENRCKEIGDGASQVSFKEFFKILGKSVSVSNAEVMFSNSNAKKTHSASQSDYISQNEVDRFFQKTPPQQTVLFDTQQTKQIGEDIDEVERVKKEAASKNLPNTDEVDEDDLSDIFQPQQSPSAEVVSAPTVNHASETMKPKTETQDDEYLSKLLDGLVDWDNI